MDTVGHVDGEQTTQSSNVLDSSKANPKAWLVPIQKMVAIRINGEYKISRGDLLAKVNEAK